MANSIIILGGPGESAKLMYNALKTNFAIEKVILENAPSRRKIIANRVKKLGFIEVFGQLLFSLIMVKILNVLSRKRKNEIVKKFNLELTCIPEDKIVYVGSVNSDLAREQINNCTSNIIVLSGTRIIGQKTLESVDKCLINIHAGITPKYRGVHGAYWALVNGDSELCGVTVHNVDRGVDTGAILAQELIEITEKDTFVTYPLLQFAVGVNLLRKILKDIFNEGRLEYTNLLTSESLQWYHPTIWRYIYVYAKLKIK
jgi:folate-dependent phosphoribosylglycinamide formyltransferase PurN